MAYLIDAVLKASSLTIYIKNMVSMRCVLVVKAELAGIGLRFSRVDLGEAEIVDDLSSGQIEQIRCALLSSGLELVEDKRVAVAEKIKKTIIDLVFLAEEPLVLNLSVYLCQALDNRYTYLADAFSGAQGQTIERFYIEQRIERVKQLLLIGEFSLTEIAFKMHYSSVSSLSSQFKKVTGNTVSVYKGLKHK
jgi:AraC-like DNA-binding protein